MSNPKNNIADDKIVDLAICVATLLLNKVGLDPTKNPKASKLLAANIKPRLARNLRKDRVGKIRVGMTTGYKKYLPKGEITDLKLGQAVADFVCVEHDLPLREHPGLLEEYANLVRFYESLLGKCTEPQALGALLSGRIRRTKKKSAPAKPRAENASGTPEVQTPESDRGVQLESEEDTSEQEFPFDDITE